MKTIHYLYTAPNTSFQMDDHDALSASVMGNPVSLSTDEAPIVHYIMRNPGASLDEVFLYILALTHRMPDMGELRSQVGCLCEEGILEIKEEPLRSHIPYRLEHTCEMCGCSCMAQLVGPLSSQELDNLMDAHRPLHDTGTVAKNVNPIMKGMRPDGTCMHFVHFPEKRCLFLGSDNLCTVHGQFGAMKKPAACRLFPHFAVETESELRIGIKPYCYANMRTCDDTLPPPNYAAEYRANNKEFYDELITSATKRPILYRVTPEEAALARLQEAAMLDLLYDETTTLPHILRTAADVPLNTPSAPLPQRFFKTLHKIFLNFAPKLRAEAQKLGTTLHADRACALCACLENPLTLPPEKVDPKTLNFIRRALFNAVFLRETMRFPAFHPGVFALALGAIAAIQDPQHTDTHFTAWMRLFAQTQAFMLLFDSPMALSELTHALE
ncbi:MAG: hypothetical protein IIY06_01220 [Proteobacteria bacterium]|nr:hypothetical protein [Pseudomonadota bacterium]